MAKVLVGLSGGVDSSVAAGLLLEQGHEVVGGYMKNWINEDDIAGDCPWEQDVKDAHAVAEKLGIEFRVIDLIDAYKERIVDYLLSGYQSGITPNPDVFCNREMKFGVFLDYALSQGFESVATGHYVRKKIAQDGSSDLWRGMDPNKDQTYFLSMMTQEQVASGLFPVGEFLKPDVRALAKKMELPTAQKKDSQGICFIGNIKMADFLSHYVPDSPGNIVDVEGKTLGAHRGLHFYTLGQRKGHGVASPRHGIAYVVVGKDFERNELVVGYEDTATEGLYSKTCIVGEINATNAAFYDGQKLEAQPRYRAKSEPAQLKQYAEDQWEVTFENPQRALTPGQVCAFYDQGKLLGGSVFQSIGE